MLEFSTSQIHQPYIENYTAMSRKSTSPKLNEADGERQSNLTEAADLYRLDQSAIFMEDDPQL